MSRPGVGNPGNKGGQPGRSGRKGAYQELQSALWHQKVFEQAQDVEALERKILTKRYSGQDMAALRLLKGDKYIVGKFMDKLVPDLHEVTGKDGAPLFLPSEIINKNELHPDPGAKGDSD